MEPLLSDTEAVLSAPKAVPTAIPRVSVSAGVLFIVTLLASHGCASRRPIAMDIRADSTFDLVWPAAPDDPRIRYLRSVSSPGDLGVSRSFFGRVADVVFGEGESLRIRQPYGIAVDSAQQIYVADQASAGVHVFDPVGGRHRLFRGTDRSLFELPVGVAVDESGRIYVADSKTGLVLGMSSEGEEFLRISEGLERPAGLAFDSDRKLLYVVDVLRHEVLAYDSVGSLVRVLGGRGNDPGRMNYPTNVTVGSDGTVYVTDTMNFRVMGFDAEGNVISSFGRNGDRPGELARPKGIGVDSEGHIYVVEGLFDSINVFDRTGQHLLSFGGPGGRPGEFWLATGLYVDANDRIYVADSFNGRFQVFQYLSGAEGP